MKRAGAGAGAGAGFKMKPLPTIAYIALNLFIALLAMNVIALAYVPSEDYNGVKVKFYANVSHSDCYKVFDRINQTYFKNINYISIWNKRILKRGLPLDGKYASHRFNLRVVGGFLPSNRNIELYDGCTLSTIQHELAHDCQMVISPESVLTEELMHDKYFRGCLDEIERNTRYDSQNLSPLYTKELKHKA